LIAAPHFVGVSTGRAATTRVPGFTEMLFCAEWQYWSQAIFMSDDDPVSAFPAINFAGLRFPY
jgi:hypothetical protein